MRIAHVISSPSGIGGAEAMLLTLVKAGIAQGWPQRVLHPFGQSENSLIGTQLPTGTYGAFPVRSVFEVPRVARWTARQLRNFRPDIVHVHLFHALVLVASLPRPGSARLLLTHHHGNRYEVGGQRLRQVVDRVAVRRYDVVVAVSPATETLLEQDYHLRKARVRMIENGWTGQPLPRKSQPGKRVICVANLRPEKRHDLLIQAFAAVSAKHQDAELVLVGDGPLRSGLEEQVRTLGLSGRVVFTGAVSNVWPLLADADVFALASDYETLGLAVLEAMAAGLPVVVTAVGGLLDLVEPGSTGLFAPPNDGVALAASLTALLDSPKARLRMGTAGRIYAGSHRSDRMVDGYLRLYEELAAGVAWPRSG